RSKTRLSTLRLAARNATPVGRISEAHPPLAESLLHPGRCARRLAYLPYGWSHDTPRLCYLGGSDHFCLMRCVDMTLSVGDQLPDITLKTNGADGPEDISVGHFCKGRKVVLFAVPGAFTPDCSNTHMPGFVVHADRILEKADAIACLAVNDAFVLGAWQEDQNAGS